MFRFLKDKSFVLVAGILILAAIGISIQKLIPEPKIIDGQYTTAYNNYLIFKTSSQHFFAGKDLYKLHPRDHFDHFKYSPAFAILMYPFSSLPNWLGLTLWNLLNVIVLLIAINQLPQLKDEHKAIILLIGAFELFGSIMNSQSNALMTGLMILSVTQLEKRNPVMAALFLTLSVYIKIFSIVLGLFFIFYKRKRIFIFASIVWFVIFTFGPAIFGGWDYLSNLYQSWWNLLQTDFNASAGYSVSGILNTWFGLYPPKTIVTILGAILLLLPLYRTGKYNHLQYRMYYLAYILLWVIIFNHRAESPTFIVAMTGVGIWYIYSHKNIAHQIILAIAIIFVSLAYSDIAPQSFRVNYMHPYFVKAFPCILIWLIISFKLIYGKILRIYNY